jgi:hypothetical protein
MFLWKKEGIRWRCRSLYGSDAQVHLAQADTVRFIGISVGPVNQANLRLELANGIRCLGLQRNDQFPLGLGTRLGSIIQTQLLLYAGDFS